MPYLILTTDKPGSAELRAATRAAHLAWIKDWAPRILAGGGFIDDAGDSDGGGLVILDTESRAEAEAFAAADPYTLAGLFADVSIRRWRKVIFAGQLLPPA